MRRFARTFIRWLHSWAMPKQPKPVGKLAQLQELLREAQRRHAPTKRIYADLYAERTAIMRARRAEARHG